MIVTTFFYLITIDMFLRYFCRIRHDLANAITCSIVQTYFVYQASELLYTEYYGYHQYKEYLNFNTINNINVLTGYFIYDLAYLSVYPSTFIFHHIISLLAIYYINIDPIPTTFYYNLACISMESVNPFLNIRHVTKGTIFYKPTVFFIFLFYTVFRIVGFPFISYKCLTLLEENNIIYFLFFIIYGMTLFWYRNVINMTRHVFS